MTLQAGLRAEISDSRGIFDRRIDNALDRGAAQLDEALSRLESVWSVSRRRVDQADLARAQRYEQHVQALTVQSAYWKREAEKRAAASASALAAIQTQQADEQGKVETFQTERDHWQQKARQWQERAESWKEEARRSEEARVAALHNIGGSEVKARAADLVSAIDEAVVQIRAIIERKKMTKKNESALSGAVEA